MPTPTPETVGLVLEVGGASPIEVKVEVKTDDVPTIIGWSASEVILYLGQEGPLIQRGLRDIFGS